MRFRVTSGSVSVLPVEVLAIPVFEGMLDGEEVFWAFREFDRLNEGVLSARRMLELEFKGKKGQTFTAHTRIAGGVHTVLVVGMGKLADFKPADARLLTHALAKEAIKCKATTVGVAPPLMPHHEAAIFQHVTEGLVLGGYDPGVRKKDRKAFSVDELVVALEGDLMELSKAQAGIGLKAGEIIAKAQNDARDLVNLGPNEVTPAKLAVFAITLAAAHKGVLTAKILAKGECKKLGMRLFLAVAQGSREDPRFIHIVYKPPGRKKPRRKIALIGKGITFDSGGLSIKTAKGMEDMKCDMAGGAAVLCAMQAIAQLKPPMVEVHALVAATENMPGGSAYRPGDLLKGMGGRSVQVLNTDAEGRLTLADAIAYANEVVEAEEIVELSTLTGACVVALGDQVAGYMTTDDEFSARFATAAKDAGEDVWRLPLPEAYKEYIKGDSADLKNLGKEGTAGPLTAGLFLQEFAEGTPLVHCDIAGTAHANQPWGVHPKGGTGFGVPTLVEYVMNVAIKEATA